MDSKNERQAMAPLIRQYLDGLWTWEELKAQASEVLKQQQGARNDRG